MVRWSILTVPQRVTVSSGAPNKAASGFFSNILREPLAGKEALLPVGEEVRHWYASPRAAVGFLIHAATMDLSALGTRRNLSMPGLSATVGEQIAALRRVAGDRMAALIRREPDATIAGIVAGWPRNFDPARAVALGFRAETSFDEIIRAHVDDELGGMTRVDPSATLASDRSWGVQLPPRCEASIPVAGEPRDPALTPSQHR